MAIFDGAAGGRVIVTASFSAAASSLAPLASRLAATGLPATGTTSLPPAGIEHVQVEPVFPRRDFCAAAPGSLGERAGLGGVDRFAVGLHPLADARQAFDARRRNLPAAVGPTFSR